MTPNNEAKVTEALRCIEAYCNAKKDESEPSTFAPGCNTMTGASCLARNILRYVDEARRALAEGRPE